MKGCRALTKSEMSRVLDAFNGRYRNRDRALFLMGIKTGFRISEMLSLKVGDVFQNGQVVEQVSVRRSNMKSKREGRTVPLHPEAKTALGIWMDQLGTDDPHLFVFRSRNGSNRAIGRAQAHNILKRAYRISGLTGKLASHSMRKSFAAGVHKALGNDLYKTQKALGHANIESTIKYLSFNNKEIEAAILSL